MTKSFVFPTFLNEPVDTVAQKLLGCLLVSTVGGKRVVVRIVETEAYDQEDEASHAFGGKRTRNSTMFAASGHLYVYFTYGMHYCCNVVSGNEGYGSGCLIRAVEPLSGEEYIAERRTPTGPAATNGPAKLCAALGIDLALNGHDLHEPPIQLFQQSLKQGETITQTTRIGITKAAHRPRRYYITQNKYVSHY